MNKAQVLEGNSAPLSPFQTIITPQKVQNYLPCEGPTQFSFKHCFYWLSSSTIATQGPLIESSLAKQQGRPEGNRQEEKFTEKKKKKNAKMETKKEEKEYFLFQVIVMKKQKFWTVKKNEKSFPGNERWNKYRSDLSGGVFFFAWEVLLQKKRQNINK